MKIRPLEDELFHADRRTDMTKLREAFHSFANTPNTRAGETEYYSTQTRVRQRGVSVHTRAGAKLHTQT